MIVRILLAVGLLFGGAGLALADSDEFSGPGYLSSQQVRTQLSSAGYSVLKIKADDGRYKVKALTSDKHKVKLSVDPRSGAIVSKGDDNDD